GQLLHARPDDRLAGRVDLGRERHALVVVDARDRGGEREGDAVEGVVVVVQDDDPPGVAGARARVLPLALDGRCERRRHCASNVAMTASAMTTSGRPDTWLALRRRAKASASVSFSFSISRPLAR